jgi:hypothetical protein
MKKGIENIEETPYGWKAKLLTNSNSQDRI